MTPASPRGATRRAAAAGCAGASVVNAIERAAAPGLEYAEIRFDPSGTATVLTGAMSQGQAHETTFKQILHDRLGLDPGAIRYLQGDTDKVAFSVGTFGSRSAAIAGSALVVVADKLVAKGKRIAAHLLEAAEADIEFAAGRFTVAGTDRALDLRAVAKAAFVPDRLPAGVEPGFFENGTFSPEAITYPNGCHVCEVEIDPETGATAIVAYTVVDDVGTVVNPLTLKGPDPRRRRAGSRAGADGAGGLRPRVRPAPARRRSWTTACRAPTTSARSR